MDPARGYDKGYAEGRYRLSNAYGRGYADGEAGRPYASASGIRGAAGAGLNAGYDVGYRDGEGRRAYDTTYAGWTFEVWETFLHFTEGVIHCGDLAPPPRHAALADALLAHRGDPPDDPRRAHDWMRWNVCPAELHDAGWTVESPDGETAGQFCTAAAAHAWIDRRHRWRQTGNSLLLFGFMALLFVGYIATCSFFGPR